MYTKAKKGKNAEMPLSNIPKRVFLFRNEMNKKC